jgi:hypothetical protein
MAVEENRAVAETERKMGQGGRESNGRDLWRTWLVLDRLDKSSY